MCYKTCLSFIKSTQYEEDVCAEALGDLPLVAEEAGQAVDQEAVGEKLSNTQQGQQPLETLNSIEPFKWARNMLLTSIIPSIQLSAIQPKGPLILASDATGAKKLANLILLKHKLNIFQFRSFIP